MSHHGLARKDCSFRGWQDTVSILQPRALSEPHLRSSAVPKGTDCSSQENNPSEVGRLMGLLGLPNMDIPGWLWHSLKFLELVFPYLCLGN